MKNAAVCRSMPGFRSGSYVSYRYLNRENEMKIIISYMDGSSEIISVSSMTQFDFGHNDIALIHYDDSVKYIPYSDIRSIVIA